MKHLTDHELMEKNVESTSHIKECEWCQQRLEHLAGVRAALVTMSDKTAPDSLWHAIQQQLNATSNQVVKLPSRSRKKTWLSFNLGLAASIAFILGIFLLRTYQLTIPNDSFANKTEANLNKAADEEQLNAINTMDQLMAENFQLQKRLNAENSLVKVSIEYFELNRQLMQIDNEIANAYLQKFTQEQKKILWQARIQVLKSMLEIKQAKPKSNYLLV